MLSQLKTVHSRRFLLIYLAIVIMLLLVIAEQYADDDRPQATLSGHKTFEPPASLPQLLLETPSGVRSNVHFKDQWTYLVFTDPDCEQHCEAPSRVLSAVSSALGRSAPTGIALTTDTTDCPAERLDMICGLFDDAQQRALLKKADMSAEHIDDRQYSNTILLINPQAKLQRRYQLPLDSTYLIKDFISQRREYARSPASSQR